MLGTGDRRADTTLKTSPGLHRAQCREESDGKQEASPTPDWGRAAGNPNHGGAGGQGECAEGHAVAQGVHTGPETLLKAGRVST